MAPLPLNEDGTLPWYRDPNGKPFLDAAIEAIITDSGGGGGPHTHPESDVTNLTTDLAAKAPTAHSHAGEDITSGTVADARIAAALARDSEVTSAVSTHEGAGNPHPTYATDADLTTHAAGPHGGSLPSGLIVMWGGLVANIPAGWVLCDGQNGTPDLRDRFIKGANGEAGGTGGSATHGHTTTQPDAHAALSHSGATVGNHAFTQPSAHSDHAALSHTAHAGASVGDHADVTNHLHTLATGTGATGNFSQVIGTVDTSSGGTGGTPTQTALATRSGNPVSGGVTAMVHTVGQASAHSDHAAQSHSAHSGGAVDAHTVGQASNHASQSHTGAAVNTVNSEPAYFALCFIQKV